MSERRRGSVQSLRAEVPQQCDAESASSARIRNRRPQHLLDVGRARRQHHQPVKPKGYSTRKPDGCKRGNEIIVDWIALAVDALLFVHFRAKPPTLLARVTQLAEAVGELNAADVKLE